MKGCKGKKKRTEDTAFRLALRQSAQYGVPLRPYHCEVCGYWHLTTQPRRGVLRRA